MIMRGRGHIFEDPRVLNEMLMLRQKGVGPSDLGRHYAVDHTTIIYHCKRYGVLMPRTAPRATITSVVMDGTQVSGARPRVVVTVKSAQVMTDWNGEVLCKGKTYAEYVAYSRQMDQIRRFGRVLLPEQKKHQ
jgi:hypothetical protein